MEARDCKISFAPQMWAARPHLGSIFEKLLHLPNRIQVVFLRIESSNHEPQANKSFSVQQFFKNAGEVQGEQP